MGEMIGNIAHQWRQPLGEISAILMNLQVKHEFNDLNPEVLLQSIHQCKKINAYMSSTISDFQNFSSPLKTKRYLNLESHVIEPLRCYKLFKIPWH